MTDRLTPAELVTATGKRRAASQAAVLARMGVPFTFLGRSVLVDRAVAMAHALLPNARPTEPPTLAVDTRRTNPGLDAWRASRTPDPEIATYRAEVDAAYREAAPERRQVARGANRAKRRADELRRTPPWADHDLIREVYAEARRLTRQTGVEHHVDHEIPLRGRLVSGLHVHTNLRAIPGGENILKGNRFDEVAQ
mgnify:FL=1